VINIQPAQGLMEVLKRPGLYLILMAWWIAVFFIIALFSYPVKSYLSSYVPFFVAFVVILASGIALNIIETKFLFWRDMGHWGRFLILTGSYAFAILVILVITLTLDSYRLIGYFRGDPEGSFGMLYVPSVIFYFLAGTILSAVLSAKGKRSPADS
jgi:hypothetical protein